MSVKIRDIARECQVSAMTVSNVLNDKGRCSQDTRDKVLKAIKRLRYDPYKNIPSSIEKEASVGIVMPDSFLLSAPFYSRAFAAFKETSKARKCNAMILTEEEVLEKAGTDLEKGKRNFHRSGLVYFCPMGSWEKSCGLLQKLSVPVAVVRRRTASVNVPIIKNNDHDGAQLALEHLWDLGHRSIGFIGQTIDPLLQDLYRGYTDFLKSKSISFSPGLVYDTTNVLSPDFYTWFRTTVSQPYKPTAFFTNDSIAANLLQDLHQTGIRVPADLSLVGYDNNSTASYTTPPLTTVHVPVEEMVRLACTLVCDQLDGFKTDTPEVTLTNKLIVRQSTAPMG